MSKGIFCRVLLTGVCTLAFTVPAFAQDQAEPAPVTPPADAPPQQTDAAAAGTEDAAGEEIIVTAQNRSQNVQDVPIAMQVVSGEDLERAGVTDFTSLQKIAPAVQITNDTNLTRVTVRGVGTNDNAETQDTSIAVNIDGEYINRPTVLNASLFDLERVEVLRGPQGTLYGRNSTGGAINFITRKPGRDFGVNFSASFGNYDAIVVQGGVDIPLGDIGGIRIAGTRSLRDGYFYHPNTDSRSGDDNTHGGRISLSLEPTDALDVDLAVEKVRVRNTIANQAFVNFNNGLGFNPDFAPGAGCNENGWVPIGSDPRLLACIPLNVNLAPSIDRSSYVSAARGPGGNEQDSTAFRGRVAYNFGPATVTYIGGYRKTDESFLAALTPAYFFNNLANDVKTQSHELRVNGGVDQGIQWQFGVFRFHEKLHIERGLFNGPPFLPPFLLGANGGYINYFDRDVKTGSWSGFGQVEVPIMETLTAVLGGRYTSDKRSGVFNNFGSGIANPASPLFNTGLVDIDAAPLSVTRPSAKADKFTWLAGLNYEPDRDTLVYAKVSTGFKPGGFDAVGSYDPETNTAYEAGVKRSFGRSTVNFAGFYYDYKDLQASVLLDPSIGGQVFNAGGATIWGLEAETTLRVFDRGRFTASVNYLKSKYDDFLASYPVFCRSAIAPLNCGSINGIGDLDSDITSAPIDQPQLAGNRPPLSPRWVLTAGYEHTFDLGSAGFITPSIFTRYKSSYYLDIFNFRGSKQGGYMQTDASIEWRHPSDIFGVQFFVRNLEDKQPLTYAGFTSAGPDDIYNFQFAAPRTYGVRLMIDYK